MVSKRAAKGSGSAHTKEETLIVEEQMHAVVIVDSLESTFRPLTLETPKVLLPFFGIPLLAYTFGFLKRNGVKDVHLVVTGACDAIQKFVDGLATTGFRSMRVEIIQVPVRGQKSLSFGDVLREIDDQGTQLGEDFLLLFGDGVHSFSLQQLIDAHKAHKAADRYTMITKCFTPSRPGGRHRSIRDDAVVIYDKETKELVAWESVHTAQTYILDPQLIQRNSESGSLVVRYDLLDNGIAVISSKSLRLFAESFDHHDLRDDFFHDILSKPIKLESLYACVLEADESDFACRASSPRTFSAAAMAVMERRTYPFVLDHVSLPGQSHLLSLGRSVFKAKDVIIGTNCDIGSHVCLLPGTVIGNNVTIRNSILERRCRIGNNVTIDQAFLLEGCILEDDVSCSRSILGFNVVAKKGAKIKMGCILGSRVTIAADFTVAPHTLLTTFMKPTIQLQGEDIAAVEGGQDSDDGSSESGDELDKQYRPTNGWIEIPQNDLKKLSEDLTDSNPAGPGGVGVIYGAETNAEVRACGSLLLHTIGTDIGSYIPMYLPKMALDGDSTDTEEDDRPLDDAQSEISSDVKEINSNDEFVIEVREFITSGLQNPTVLHHKLLECKSFRLASNRSDSDVIAASIDPVLESLSSVDLEFSDWMDAFNKNCTKKVFESFFDDSSEIHHITIYDAILSFCLRKQTQDPESPFAATGALSFLLQVLARLEIVDDEYTLLWYRRQAQILKSRNDDASIRIRKLLNYQNLLDYIEYLAD